MAVVLGLAGTLRAEPLDLEQVAADAKWVAQVDFDAARASSVLHNAIEHLMQKHPDAKEHLAAVREIWKFDPRADLHGVTIYGTQIKKDTGAAIVHAKVDQQLLLEKARKAHEHQASDYGKYELHTWKHKHPKGPEHGRMMTGVFYKPDVIVFGSLDEVKAALDVLDGAKPNLAGKDSPLAGAVPQGAILVARAVGLAEAELPCKSPLIRQMDSFALAVGENQDESFFEGKLTVKRTELAQQIMAVVEGVRAMSALAHGGDAEAMKIINALKVSAGDKSVGVEWRAPAKKVWEHLRKMGEMEEGRKARKAWHLLGKPDRCPVEEE